MLGAGVAWLLGMLPSTMMALLAEDHGQAAIEPPSAAVRFGLAALLGLVAGPVLGFAQWLVLRRHRPGAWRWLGANAAAWAAGMPLIFLGMDLLPWERGGLGVAAGIYSVCAAAGLVVGAIHGRVLLRVAGEPPPDGG
jgi:hypothetical protein